MKSTSGLTLVELMVTAAILGIGVLAMLGSFRYISTSIQYSKEKTLANNLVVEQIEKLKNLQYYSLLVTTTFSSDSRFTPSLDYDNLNYPAIQISQGGMTFTRMTRVDFAYQDGTTITTAPYTSSDTGLKMITVYVTWQDDSGLRYQELHSLMANPAANPLNATFTGTVLSTSGAALAGVVVKTIDNPNWYATTDASGRYQFSVSSGNYTLNSSSRGYFSADRTAAAPSGLSMTVNFTLSRMSSGTASGYAYLDNHLVISQVVASTGPGNTIEYIALYNPTISAIFIGDATHDGEGGHPMPSYVPVVWQFNNALVSAHHLHYVNATIPSHATYLISNTGDADPATTCSPFAVAGQPPIQPDACWNHAYYLNGGHEHQINCGGSCPGPYTPDAGGVAIVQAAGVTSSFNLTASWKSYRTDSVGWNQKAFGLGNAAPSDAVEGTAITPLGVPNGLITGEILGRMTDPGNVTSGFGMAYDSDDNNSNFLDHLIIPGSPGNTSTIQPPLAGTPAFGAYVTSNDPLSSPAQCDSAGHFSLPSIATGTWTLAIASNTYFLEMTNVQMTASLSTSVPNGITSPTWPATNVNNALLKDTTSYAFVSGIVTDVNNVAMSNILVNAGGKTTNTNSSGRYFVSTATGDILVIANYNNQNRGYASQSSTLLNTSVGQVYDNPLGSFQTTWFQLALTGTLVGYFQTSSSTTLPGQTLVALSGGSEVAQAVSDNTGHAYLMNLSTGTYTLEPALDPLSSVSPTATVVTLTSTGTATSVSTFTVSSGLAQITGQVLIGASSAPITTGVTILVTSSTLSGTLPPALNGGLGTLCAPCYYGASSDSTGQYTVSVRSSPTPYQIYGWYTTFSGSTSSTTLKGPYSLTVSSAGAIVPQNISW